MFYILIYYIILYFKLFNLFVINFIHYFILVILSHMLRNGIIFRVLHDIHDSKTQIIFKKITDQLFNLKSEISKLTL